MKKQYKTPQLIIVNVQLQKMMAGSPYGKDIKEGNASHEYDVLSRRGNDIWDDEDDED